MKISSNTLKVMKNFTSISDVIYLNNKGGIVVIAPGSTILGVAETDEDLDFDNCVFHDWASFLSIIQAFGNENAELDFEDNHVVIKNESGGKIKYFYSNKLVLSKDYKEPKPFKNYQNDFKFDAKVEVTETIWNELKKISAIMKLDKAVIEVAKDKAIIKLLSSDGSTNSVHEQELETFEGEGEIALHFNSLNLIGGNYEFLFMNNKAAKIVNKDVPVFYVTGKMKG